MKLAIVTAVRNAVAEGRRAGLIRCIHSVAALKTPHEHLVYDGASTDGTVELLRELEVKTPGLAVISEPDTGIYNALNKGLRNATGEWFYVLGCDDFISHPAVLDRIIAESRTFDIVASPVESGGKPGQFQSKRDLKWILWTMPYCHQGIVMRTSVCRDLGGFDETYRIVADYDILWKAHAAGLRFRYVFEPFADFSKSGASHGFPERMERDFAACRANHLRLAKPLFRKEGRPAVLPLRCLLPFFLHRDFALRCSARFFAVRWLKALLRPLLIPILRAFRPQSTQTSG